MLTALVFVLGAAAFWAVICAALETNRDRRRTLLGFVSTTVGGLLGLAVFGSPGAMLALATVLSVGALSLSLRPAPRQVVWGPIPVVRTEVELRAS